MSELDKSELISLEGRKAQLDKAVATGLQAAIPFLAAHSAYVGREIARLSGDDVLGVFDKDKDKTRAEQSAMAMAKAMGDHAKFSGTDGFKTKEDFFTFGKNLENDEYWQFLQDNPDEMDKVALNFANSVDEKLKNGEITPEEHEEIINQSSRTKQVYERGLVVREELKNIGRGNGNSLEVENLKRAVEDLGSPERVEAMIAARESEERNFGEIALGASEKGIVATEKIANATYELKKAVHTKAKDLGFADERKEVKDADDDLFASLLKEEGTGVAVNNLKQTQENAKDSRISTPVEIEIAQNTKAAERAVSDGNALS